MMVEVKSDQSNLVCLSSDDDDDEDLKTALRISRKDLDLEMIELEPEVLTVDESDEDDIVCIDDTKKGSGKKNGESDDVEVLTVKELKRRLSNSGSETDFEENAVVNEEDDEGAGCHSDNKSEDDIVEVGSDDDGGNGGKRVEENQEQENIEVNPDENDETMLETDEELNDEEEEDGLVDVECSQESKVEDIEDGHLEDIDQDVRMKDELVNLVQSKQLDSQNNNIPKNFTPAEPPPDDGRTCSTANSLENDLSAGQSAKINNQNVIDSADEAIILENISSSQEVILTDDDDDIVLVDETTSSSKQLSTGDTDEIPLSPGAPEYKKDTHQALTKFYQEFCHRQPRLDPSDRQRLKDKLSKHFQRITKSSATVHKQLTQEISSSTQELGTSPASKWLSVEKLTVKLKSAAGCSKSEEKSPKKQSNPDRDLKKQQLIEEYERQLNKSLEELKAWEEREVDLEEEENSVYLLQDQIAKRLMKDYYNLCDLTQSNHLTGQFTQVKIKLRESSGYPDVDAKLERLVNENGCLVIPEYADVFEIVEKYADGLAGEAIEKLSRKMFNTVGSQVKSRRKKEFKVSMLAYLKKPNNGGENRRMGEDEEKQEKADPAVADPELEAKLKENEKEKKTVDKFLECLYKQNAKDLEGVVEEEEDEEEDAEEIPEESRDFNQELSEDEDDEEPKVKKSKLCSNQPSSSGSS